MLPALSSALSGLATGLSSFANPSTVLGLASTGYNLYTNKRDFDYQDALQRELLEREDTKYTRARADLENAGYNPNLALGSQYGAGQVVSRSSTNDVNFGAALDYSLAYNQIQNQKVQTNVAHQQYAQAKIDTMLKKIQAGYDTHKMLEEMGIPNYVNVEDNGVQVYPDPHFYLDTDSPNLIRKELSARGEEAEWVYQKHQNELTQLFQNGQKILTEQQKLTLEYQKANIDTIWKSYQMNQTSLVDTINAYAKILGVKIDADKLSLELKKLDWSKEKYSYEFLLGIINSASSGATDSLGL